MASPCSLEGRSLLGGSVRACRVCSIIHTASSIGPPTRMHVGPVPMDGAELLHDLDLGDAVTIQAGASRPPGTMVSQHLRSPMLSSTFHAGFHSTN